MKKVVLFLVGMFLLASCGHYSQEPTGNVKSARLYGKFLQIIKPRLSAQRFENLTVFLHNVAKGEELVKKTGSRNLTAIFGDIATKKEIAKQVGQDVLNEYELYTRVNVLNQYSQLLFGEKANLIKFSDKISKTEVKRAFRKILLATHPDAVKVTASLSRKDVAEVFGHINKNFSDLMKLLDKQQK